METITNSVSVYVCMSVCLFAHNSGTAVTIASKLSNYINLYLPKIR